LVRLWFLHASNSVQDHEVNVSIWVSQLRLNFTELARLLHSLRTLSRFGAKQWEAILAALRKAGTFVEFEQHVRTELARILHDEFSSASSE
ncbi:hypothetical protein, partial [Acinetobacter baumannii]|uniref:hypothetical protein n=1 Tax=Acinetobacter baumannii TaxID=470 RepID=UPI001C07EE58